MEISSIFETIGNVLGYPAMLLIFWLYIKVKDTATGAAELAQIPASWGGTAQ